MMILNYESKKQLKENIGKELNHTETSRFGVEWKISEIAKMKIDTTNKKTLIDNIETFKNKRQAMLDNINAQDLEQILDVLCKMTERDIFVMLPEDHVEAKEYLIKEIKQTVERL